jgi:ADP-ribose pyrophosphatase
MRQPRVLSRKIGFRGVNFYVTTERVREPNGVTARRDIVRHPGSVAVLAVDSRSRVVLERQYRYAANAYLWELPAGHIDPGEQPLAAAKRELLEETGYTARRWRRLLFFYPSPGFLQETMTVYLAEGLRAGVARQESDERIQARLFPLTEVTRMAATGRLRDAKTIAAVLAYAMGDRGRSQRRA